jgi:phosphate transport system substrate-binding protein
MLPLVRTRISICMAATALALGALGALGAAGAATAAAASLSGAGSTLIEPLLKDWASAWQNQTGNAVTYGAGGSLAGITQVSARTADFGASDAPLTPAQAAACNGCAEIPWALSATAIVFHLDGTTHLKLSASVLADIYLGHITKWNDTRIARLNKRVALPALAITPVYRSDGSGDTYAFTDYLTDVSRGWASKVGRGALASFPKGMAAKGNTGVGAAVAATNGAIGYLGAPYVLTTRLPVAALENRAGRFEYPNLDNIESAGQTVSRVPQNGELHIVDPPRTARTAYPISTFTYVIVPQSPRQKALLQSWIAFALTTGQQYGPALDFAKLPSVVLSASQRALGALT